MSSDEHRVSRSVYVAVLSKDEQSPLAPESDEEKGAKECARSQMRKVRTGATGHADKAQDKVRQGATRPATSDERQRQRQETGRARRREDRPRWHRPAHPVAAHSREELPRDARRGRPGCCSWPKARWSSREDDIPQSDADAAEVRPRASARSTSSSTTSTTSPSPSMASKILYRKGESVVDGRSTDDAADGGRPPSPASGR